MPVRRLLLALSFTYLFLPACGHQPGPGQADGGSGSLEGLTAIEISPPNATLVVEGDTATSATYSARGSFADGHTEDLSSRLQFVLGASALGSFAGAQLTTGTSLGGRTSIVVSDGKISGTTQVTIQIKKRYRDPAVTDLPADPAALFAAGAAAMAPRIPELVYPNDGVLVPPNLGKLEFHFRPGTGNTLFELAFSSPLIDVRVYTRCTVPLNGGCIFLPNPTVWQWIAESDRGGGMTAKVRATDDAGTQIGASGEILVNFSQDNIEGGVYYWTTPKGGMSSDSAIMRWDFGSTTQTAPEKVVGTNLTGNKCVGCHTISPDGNRLLTASDGSYNANLLLFDLATQLPLVPFDSSPPNAYTSFNKDASRFVGTFADNTQTGFQSYDLNFFDGATGAFIETVAVGGSEDTPSAHPDWSSTGDAIAYTRIGVAGDKANGTTASGARSNVRVVRREAGVWTAPFDLTTAAPGKGSYYPAFSPDASLVVFNRSSCSSGSDGGDCDMYDDPQASVHLIAPESGAQSVALTRGNAPGKEDVAPVVENSFPKWVPFTFHRTSETSSRLMWLTVSSDRSYGLRRPEAGYTLIWMIAIDPDAVAAGVDPSFPAFALPFQNIATDNHTAQWTTKVVGTIL